MPSVKESAFGISRGEDTIQSLIYNSVSGTTMPLQTNLNKNAHRLTPTRESQVTWFVRRHSGEERDGRDCCLAFPLLDVASSFHRAYECRS